MLEKARKMHFRIADTRGLGAQFANSFVIVLDADDHFSASLHYDIFERSSVVRFVCESSADLTDHAKHFRRLEILQARVALCARQESRPALDYLWYSNEWSR